MTHVCRLYQISAGRQALDRANKTIREPTKSEISRTWKRGDCQAQVRRKCDHCDGIPVHIVRLDFINGDRYSTRQKRQIMEASIEKLPLEQRRSILPLAQSTSREPILDALRTRVSVLKLTESSTWRFAQMAW